MRKQYWQAVAALSGGVLLPFLLSYALGDQTAGATSLQAFLNWIGTTFQLRNVVSAQDVRAALQTLLSGVCYAALIYLAVHFRFLRYLAAAGIVFALNAACGALPELAGSAQYGEYAALFVLTAVFSALFFSALYLLLYPLIRLARRFLKKETLSVAAGAAAYYAAELLVILLMAAVFARIISAVDPSQLVEGNEGWMLVKEIFIERFLTLALGVLFYLLIICAPQRNRKEGGAPAEGDAPAAEDIPGEGDAALEESAPLDEDANAEGGRPAEEAPAQEDAPSAEAGPAAGEPGDPESGT